MRLRAAAAFAVLAAASTLAAGGASPEGAVAGGGHVETRTVGSVTATLSWQGEFAETTRFRIAIDRAGQRVLETAVRTRECPGSSPGYACLWPVYSQPLSLRDLDGDGEPEAVVAGFTGGAHCCVIAIVYRWDGSAYVREEHNFFDPGYHLKDLDGDGRFEFRSADARFAYLYGSFAESVFPIQILALEEGEFVAVTGEFADAVAKDLRRTKREYRRRVESRRRIGLRPALAAYVADLFTLDRRAEATAILEKALDRGLLKRQNRFDVGPFGREFIRDLLRNLRRWSYADLGSGALSAGDRSRARTASAG